MSVWGDCDISLGGCHYAVNISNYPEHQKTMEKWVSISAKRHIDFENIRQDTGIDSVLEEMQNWDDELFKTIEGDKND